MIAGSLFTVASKAITIKIATDEEEEDVVRVKDFRIRHPLQTYILKEEDTPSSEIQRTSTGIISNRRPITGTPVSGLPSGAATPVPESAPRLSLIATAKREAARRGLYAKFFRGPILGPNEPDAAPKSNPSPSHSNPMSDDALKATTKQRKRKKSKDRAETKDEKRMRRRLKEQSRGARKNRDQDVEESCLSPPSKKKRRR